MALLLILAALMAFGGVAFAAGRATAPATTTPTSSPTYGGFGPGMGYPWLGRHDVFRMGGMYVGIIGGTVQSVDSSSLTIQLRNGATVTVALTSKTSIRTARNASSAELKTGQTVWIELADRRTPTAAKITITSP